MAASCCCSHECKRPFALRSDVASTHPSLCSHFSCRRRLVLQRASVSDHLCQNCALHTISYHLHKLTFLTSYRLHYHRVRRSYLHVLSCRRFSRNICQRKHTVCRWVPLWFRYGSRHQHWPYPCERARWFRRPGNVQVHAQKQGCHWTHRGGVWSKW